MANYCFGVDIGGTTVKIGLFLESGKMTDKWEITTRKEDKGSKILPDVATSIKAKMKEKKIRTQDVIGIGMGVPGPVTSDGTVLKCVNLGWGIREVEKEVVRLTGINKVRVANDANVAALGEMWKGGGRGHANMVMITLGTGVGGGVILGGKILAGNRGAAGEIGHINVNKDEKEKCNCGGKGCLEQYASATGIVKEAKRLLAKTTQSSKLRNVKHISAKTIFDFAKEVDALSLELVEQLGDYLGKACSFVAYTIDPEAFVIGGGVSRAGSILTDVIKKHYEERVMFALQGKEFKLAELGNDAGMYGCARLVLDK